MKCAAKIGYTARYPHDTLSATRQEPPAAVARLRLRAFQSARSDCQLSQRESHRRFAPWDVNNLLNALKTLAAIYTARVDFLVLHGVQNQLYQGIPSIALFGGERNRRAGVRQLQILTDELQVGF